MPVNRVPKHFGNTGRRNVNSAVSLIISQCDVRDDLANDMKKAQAKAQAKVKVEAMVGAPFLNPMIA